MEARRKTEIIMFKKKHKFEVIRGLLLLKVKNLNTYYKAVNNT